MARLTIELRTLLKIKDFKLFDFDYPTISQEWRDDFEKRFKDVYYFYEIGQESPDRFKHNLKSRLNELMPLYNQYLEAQLKVVDPFIIEKIEEDYKEQSNKDTLENRTGTSQDNSSLAENGESNTLGSDYPQHAVISNDIPSDRRESTSSSVSTQQAFNNSSLKLDGVESEKKDYIKVISKQGNNIELLAMYMDTVNDITARLIKDLKTCFLLVY